MKNKKLLSLSLFGTLVLASCGSGRSNIKVMISGPTEFEADDTITLSAAVTGAEEDYGVDWSFTLPKKDAEFEDAFYISPSGIVEADPSLVTKELVVTFVATSSEDERASAKHNVKVKVASVKVLLYGPWRVEEGKSIELSAEVVNIKEGSEDGVVWSSSDETVAKVEDGVVTVVAEGLQANKKVTITAKSVQFPEISGSRELTVTPPQVWTDEETPLAQGYKNFSYLGYEEKAEILFELEKYVLDNFLGGIPYRDDARGVLYSTRLELASETYVPNYGFGVGESTITSAMTAEQEPNEAHRKYFHTWTTQDPGTVNYWNGKDSVTSDLWALFNASYYSTEFNDKKDGYQWYSSLAKEKPIALNADEVTGMATKWEVKLKTVEDDPNLVYHTLSTKEGAKAFDGQGVKIEDYLTPFEAMIKYNLFRATDLGSKDSGFVGVSNYLKAEEKDKAKLWDKIGIKLNDARDGIVFEFNSAKTQFYAMYNLASSLFSPLPKAFLDDYLGKLSLDDNKLSGAERYGKAELGADGVLSLGMYTLEKWELDKSLSFKKNPRYFEKERASFEGYKYTILQDSNVAYDEFKAGKLDSVGVPSTKLQSELDNPQLRKTLGSTVWKLQVNALDEAGWLELFGPSGNIYRHPKHTAENPAWELKPALSNSNFLEGLYYSVNREKVANSEGSIATQTFLSSAYMVDPEGGVGWRDHELGKEVAGERHSETTGYNLEVAREYFQAAIDELVTAKKYPKGSKANPTVITLKMIFQDNTQVNEEGAILKKDWEDAFKGAFPDGDYKLVIEPYATADWMDAYYGPMRGEFDLAFGSISGNTLDPISFFSTVLTDNRSGFTLSWGVDTNTINYAKPEKNIVYKGEVYSFQALYEAAVTGVNIVDGISTNDIEDHERTFNLAKKAGLAAVNAAFEELKEADYSPENWALLVSKKDVALSMLEGALTLEEVEAAEAYGLAALAGVKPLAL